jgi:hypothetical protein
MLSVASLLTFVSLSSFQEQLRMAAEMKRSLEPRKPQPSALPSSSSNSSSSSSSTPESKSEQPKVTLEHKKDFLRKLKEHQQQKDQSKR